MRIVRDARPHSISELMTSAWLEYMDAEITMGYTQVIVDMNVPIVSCPLDIKARYKELQEVHNENSLRDE